LPAAERSFSAYGRTARQGRGYAATCTDFPPSKPRRRPDHAGDCFHLDFPDFAAELDAVIGRARTAGIGRLVTISTRVKRHAQVLAIAERFPEVFCSVGTHPNHAHEEPDVDAKALTVIAKHPKVVAIGEAGLDYFRNTSPREAQAARLRQHIAAARETELPLVIHSRDCDADMAQILKEEKAEARLPRSCIALPAGATSPLQPSNWAATSFLPAF
jgi:TatD DNase family protein